MKKQSFRIVAFILSCCLLVGCEMAPITSSVSKGSDVSKEGQSIEPTDKVGLTPTTKPTNTPSTAPTLTVPPTPTNTPTPKPTPTNTPTPKPTNTPTPKPTATNTPVPTKAEGTGQNGGEGFNKYNNEDQQKTEDQWVLNVKSMKIHYPSCNDVKKIKPENYSTSNLSLDELLKQGYTKCGHCFK